MGKMKLKKFVSVLLALALALPIVAVFSGMRVVAAGEEAAAGDYVLTPLSSHLRMTVNPPLVDAEYWESEQLGRGRTYHVAPGTVLTIELVDTGTHDHQGAIAWGHPLMGDGLLMSGNDEGALKYEITETAASFALNNAEGFIVSADGQRATYTFGESGEWLSSMSSSSGRGRGVGFGGSGYMFFNVVTTAAPAPTPAPTPQPTPAPTPQPTPVPVTTLPAVIGEFVNIEGLVWTVPPAPVAGEPLHYTVQPGETVWGVAFNFYGSMQSSAINRIIAANREIIPANRALEAGMVLTLPAQGLRDPIVRDSLADAAGVYLVRAGDNLADIALHFYGDRALWRIIRDANRGRIGANNMIWAGQWLVIPQPE